MSPEMYGHAPAQAAADCECRCVQACVADYADCDGNSAARCTQKVVNCYSRVKTKQKRAIAALACRRLLQQQRLECHRHRRIDANQ